MTKTNNKAEQILDFIRKNGELNNMKDELGVKTYAPVNNKIHRDHQLMAIQDELVKCATQLNKLANRLARLQ